ncbi:MAG: hypothetical protein E7163_04380 [Firmicutes bacterium]|nr:hypothetical protein [Bacillota bacterium]
MKDKITVIIFISYLLLFSITHIIIKDQEMSYSERRYLATFPEFELSGEYIKELDEYLLDHFPLRNTFRSIKANFSYKVLNKLENNDIYLKNSYIFKSNYPTNYKSISNFINKTNKIKGLLQEENNIYMMIIPDKNYYIKDKHFLNIDYDYIYNEISNLDINNIDIKDLMELKDYYETDTHWKQEKLEKVIKRLSDKMNFEYKKIEYQKHVYDKFYGVYYGESAINRSPEKLKYLTNEIIDNAEVKYLENKELNKVYNKNKLDSFDAYEVYLDGASALIEIINNEASTNKELVIFRDSFGSSISPLLIPYYSRITVIDNRYINSDNIKNYIEFKNQDVLFIYSTLIINESFSLKG